jgi:hypothetical protein
VLPLTEEEDRSPKGLRALNLSLYTLTVGDLEKVLKVQEHVMVLNVTLEVEPGEEWKGKLVKALDGAKGLEQVEVVANPTLQFFMEVCAMYMFSVSCVLFALVSIGALIMFVVCTC